MKNIKNKTGLPTETIYISDGTSLQVCNNKSKFRKQKDITDFISNLTEEEKRIKTERYKLSLECDFDTEEENIAADIYSEIKNFDFDQIVKFFTFQKNTNIKFYGISYKVIYKNQLIELITMGID